ncbi:uncharacterized protein [Venturia canescens]|uniref:uncharacterized protein n=1 Tax=Venturia canescens TaxID=32260 RepID=UPI001C9CDE0D|nr:uncharacterized protein LOC122412160 [Venturia canescens]
MIEEEPLLCDWSEDEFRRFFVSDPDVNLSERQNDEAISSGLSNVTRTDSYRSEFHRATRVGDRVEMLLSDAFVSVLLTCRMEHKCYATVAYDSIKNSCRLSMPDEVEMEISKEGFFDVRVGQTTQLSIQDDELTFSSKMNAHARSVSIFNLLKTKLNDEAIGESKMLLVTTDSQGKTFKLKRDGTIIHDNRSSSKSSKKAHRLFAINRDLTGFEYLHKSERDHCLGRVNSTQGSQFIFIPILAYDFPEYRLFLNPLEPIDFSKKWLLKLRPIVKRSQDRLGFLPSTYVNPYDWLFPFGNAATSVRKPQKSTSENNYKVATLNVLLGIANEGDRFLDEVEKAVARYRLAPNKTFDDDPSFENKSSIINLFARQIEHFLENLSLGIDMNTDVIGYLENLSTKITDQKLGQVYESLKRSKQKKQQLSSRTKDFQWYERCFRERIILPYFKTIQGSCFLWIIDCVDRALQLVE